MKLFKSIFSVAIMATLFSLNACKDDDKVPVVEEPKIDMIKIGETYILGAKAKATVYAKEKLHTGYNELFVAIKDSVDGSELTNGHFDINPVMDMGMMKHGAPVENSETGLAEKGFFRSNVYFIMPGTAMQWSLNLEFHNHKNDMEGEGTLAVDVIDQTPSRILSKTLALDDSSRVFISMLAPTTPKVGLNTFEVVLHKMTSPFEFPAVEDYTIEIEPEMPSMGHGSPNNVNPVHSKDGHYAGTVNFTMTGLWKVNIRLYKNGTLLNSDSSFEITL